MAANRGVRAGAADLLLAFTRISSPSNDAAGLRAYAEALRGEFEARGFSCSIEGDPPLFVARAGPVAQRHLLLLSHLDTVLPANEPSVTGEALTATGSNDTKGGVAALLAAFDLMRERGQEPPQDLCFVAVPDEEVAGDVSKRTVRDFGSSARALWVLEPGDARPGGAETLVTGRRGMFHWRVDVRGRAAHSGLRYWQGRSALRTAARFALRALELASPGHGPTVNVARLAAGDASFVDDIASGHDLLGTERQINVVPDRAIIEGEARFLAQPESASLETALRGIAEELATSDEVAVSWSSSGHRPPVDPLARDQALSQRAVALAAAAGWRLELEADRGGLSFPNFLEPGSTIPILDGLGPVGGGMHTRDEWVSLVSLERRARLLADLLTDEAGAG